MNPTGTSTGSRSLAPPCVKQMGLKAFSTWHNLHPFRILSVWITFSQFGQTLYFFFFFFYNTNSKDSPSLPTDWGYVCIRVNQDDMAALWRASASLACGTTWHALFKGLIEHVTLICKDKIQECFVLGKLKLGTWRSWNAARKHPRLNVPGIHKISDGVFLLRWKRELTSIEHRMPVAKQMTNHLSLVL